MSRGDVTAIEADDFQVCPVEIDDYFSMKPAFLMETVDILGNQTQEFAGIKKPFEKHMGLAQPGVLDPLP